MEFDQCKDDVWSELEIHPFDVGQFSCGKTPYSSVCFRIIMILVHDASRGWPKVVMVGQILVGDQVTPSMPNALSRAK